MEDGVGGGSLPVCHIITALSEPCRFSTYSSDLSKLNFHLFFPFSSKEIYNLKSNGIRFYIGH